MKVYFWSIGLIMLLCLVFGIVAPGLISMNNTEAVILGWVLIIVSVPLSAFIGKKIYKEVKNAKI